MIEGMKKGARTYTLRFRAVDRDIFDAIRSGKKNVETRAATPKYAHMKKGEMLRFVCGAKKFEKRITRVAKFRTITGLLRHYKPEQINPKAHSKKEIEAMYVGFPGYREKLKKHGLVAFE